MGLTERRNSKQLTKICTRMLSLFSALAFCAMLFSMLSRFSSQLARHREPKEGPKAWPSAVFKLPLALEPAGAKYLKHEAAAAAAGAAAAGAAAGAGAGVSVSGH
jgi:hypothetical protein